MDLVRSCTLSPVSIVFASMLGACAYTIPGLLAIQGLSFVQNRWPQLRIILATGTPSMIAGFAYIPIVACIAITIALVLSDERRNLLQRRTDALPGILAESAPGMACLLARMWEFVRQSLSNIDLSGYAIE